jgi:DNA (cytosine-5)-methyltransferase 1
MTSFGIGGAAYYNEIDKYCAEWLRSLIGAGLIAPGDVDERDIREVKADEITKYTQCHFFAGIGGWSRALRLAGWDDARPVWTGSCPCQPFSSAGKQHGKADLRHLWPVWFGLIGECRPPVVFGEQVAAAIAHGWLDEAAHDMEGQGYAVAASVLPACGVAKPHRRDRIYFVADADGHKYIGAQRRVDGETASMAAVDRAQDRAARKPLGAGGPDGLMAHAAGERIRRGSADFSEADGGSDGALPFQPDSAGEGALGNADQPGSQGRQVLAERAGERAARSAGLEWITGPDGKSRPVEPGICLLADGVPARVGKLRAYGNAIVPQLAAEFIRAARRG